MGGGWSGVGGGVLACRIMLSAPVLVPFFWTLNLGLGFGTWIWDLDLGLDMGLTIKFAVIKVDVLFG